MITTPNMGLTAWDQPNDVFSYTELSDNWAALDNHDHTSGKGTQIPTAGIANLAVTNTKLAASAVDSTKIAAGAVTEAALSSTLSGKAVPALVTSLPGTPFDGQEIYYLASNANGVVWHLRYRSASASSYKWEFVGGSYLSDEIVTTEQTASTSAVDLTTVGPTVTFPFNGEYEIDIEGVLSGIDAAFGGGTISLRDGVTTIVSVNYFPTQGPASPTWFPRYWAGRTFRRVVVTGGTTAKLQYSAFNSTTQFARRIVAIRPVRVG